MSGRGQIAVVVSGFPRRSETFALGELLALDERGALSGIFATKPGEDGMLQPGCDRLQKRLKILPAGSAAFQAEFLARSLSGRNVSGIHGYFAHTPSDVAARAAALLSLPFGFSVHAKDARKVTPEDLTERARRAACVVACNTDVARDILPSGAPVHLVPHGVDLRRFLPHPPPTPAEPLRLLAVGRLVEKKGFHILVEAVSRLNFPFQLRIIGEGPERFRLLDLVATYGLAGRITLDGAQTHAELPTAYREAHVVVAPSVEDMSGDRDGLPNVVLEAMAAGRAVVASGISAIGSAVKHGETGMLVSPGDAGALASTLERLARRPRLLARLGLRARQIAERDFSLEKCAARFCRLMSEVYA